MTTQQAQFFLQQQGDQSNKLRCFSHTLEKMTNLCSDHVRELEMSKANIRKWIGSGSLSCQRKHDMLVPLPESQKDLFQRFGRLFDSNIDGEGSLWQTNHWSQLVREHHAREWEGKAEKICTSLSLRWLWLHSELQLTPVQVVHSNTQPTCQFATVRL